MGGPKSWGPKKKVANIEIYVIFEVFAFCGRRTKTDFKDRGCGIAAKRSGNLAEDVRLPSSVTELLDMILCPKVAIYLSKSL